MYGDLAIISPTIISTNLDPQKHAEFHPSGNAFSKLSSCSF